MRLNLLQLWYTRVFGFLGLFDINNIPNLLIDLFINVGIARQRSLQAQGVSLNKVSHEKTNWLHTCFRDIQL